MKGRYRPNLAALAGLWLLSLYAIAQAPSTEHQAPKSPWQPDLGNGTYKNPVLYADYSDPDVVRVGSDYYLVSSSFNCVPGLQILHSRDLVNWTIISAVFTEQPPVAEFRQLQHGNGVWAPAIRYHRKQFYIYYPDPDRGIYVTKASNPAGPWTPPLLIKEAKGWIDPCPLWDEDGQAYLAHAFAGSRSGIKSVLAVSRMSTDGLHVLGEDVLVFDGHAKHPTLEGPKFYKRHGYYYLFAPGGGVATGWQVVLRSKNVFGPYEDKIVLAQGKTTINGPHQGAWVDTPNGKEDWFLHFQDLGPYGRVVHLQPMIWRDDWPIIGTDADGDGTGDPVLTYRKPQVPGPPQPLATPTTSDDFSGNALGLHWQWHANPQQGWAYPNGPMGYLRLYAVPLPADYKNLWQVPNLLLQKLPAPAFTATAKLTFTPRLDGEKIALLVMGLDYAYLSITKQGEQWQLALATCTNADKGTAETTTPPVTLPATTAPLYLRLRLTAGAKCQFSYSPDGQNFQVIGPEFQAREGKWIGAKMGLFCSRTGKFNDAGNADLDWWRVEQ